MDEIVIGKKTDNVTAQLVTIPSLFSSVNVDFNLKAPLCGIEMMMFSNETIKSAFFKPRLITYDATKFINGTNIGESIKKEMSKFTKDRIKQLIAESKHKNDKKINWWYISAGIVAGVIVLSILIAFAVKKYRNRVVYTRMNDLNDE